jgi:hypothetical protein
VVSSGFLALSEVGRSVWGMQNENHMREMIEAELDVSLWLGFDEEAALAEAAGFIAEAEAVFVRLANPRASSPPPPRL